MLNKILMPSGGQTTDEMVILTWNKAVGDFVKRGDILFEIETDKAILTVESFAEGTLLDIKYPAGTMVKTGEIVAYIGEAGEVLPEKTSQEIFQKAPPVTETKINHGSNGNEKTNQLQILSATKTESAPILQNENKWQASPLAKSRAKAENIKLEDVANYFSKSLIKKNDIENYITLTKKASQEGYYFIATHSMRRTIARRMRESASVAPHYYISMDVDMGECIELRNRLNISNKNLNVKISYNDIIMKVVAKAIESVPLINSTHQDDKIKVYKDIHCGLAVALESGLVVPVVKQVNKKSIAEIAVINTENIEKAKSNKLQESDISGGTITLSNLGMLGVNNFTAIINQPESCILAIGSIMAKTVVVNRQMVIRDIMNITGSFDHRVIDGAIGAAFLKQVKEILENPHLLLL